MSKSSVYRKSGLSLLAKILIIAFCVFCATVVVVFVGKSYASGFGFADSASTSEQNQEESVLEAFDESSNQGVEVFKDEESRDVNILVSEIKAEEAEKKRIEAEEKKKRDQVCIDRGVKNKEIGRASCRERV